LKTIAPGSIWTLGFAFLCLAQLLGYASHSLLTPAFPLWVTQLGGSPFVVGLVLASFAVTSVFFRPMIGYWADAWSEAGVLISGLLLHGASILLCLIPAIEATALANALRGVAWAALNTGGYALLALTAPAERRGEASGYYSGAQGGASTLFPAIALWMIDAPLGGFRVVFAAATILSLIGALSGTPVARRAPRTIRRPPANESSSWVREAFTVFERDVLLPSAFLFCLHLSIPAVTSFVVLYAQAIGIGNVAWYFVVNGATGILARPLLGRVSDRIGRGRSLAAGFALQTIAMCLLVAYPGLRGLLVSGVCYMLGHAIGSSTTLALAVERANPERRGRAMATFSVAYPLSAGVGALLAGSTVDLAGYSWMFLLMAGVAVLGLVLTFLSWPNLKDR
jgi:MFS family permease